MGGVHVMSRNIENTFVKFDVPKDEDGHVLKVGDRVTPGRVSTSTRVGTVTYVYPDCAGCIDVRVVYDGYEEWVAQHGSCLRKVSSAAALADTLPAPAEEPATPTEAQ